MMVVIDMIEAIDTIGMAGAKSNSQRIITRKQERIKSPSVQSGYPHKSSWVSAENI